MFSRDLLFWGVHLAWRLFCPYRYASALVDMAVTPRHFCLAPVFLYTWRGMASAFVCPLF